MATLSTGTSSIDAALAMTRRGEQASLGATIHEEEGYRGYLLPISKWMCHVHGDHVPMEFSLMNSPTVPPARTGIQSDRFPVDPTKDTYTATISSKYAFDPSGEPKVCKMSYIAIDGCYVSLKTMRATEGSFRSGAKTDRKPYPSTFVSVAIPITTYVALLKKMIIDTGYDIDMAGVRLSPPYKDAEGTTRTVWYGLI